MKTLLLTLIFTVLGYASGLAQCAMCAATVESHTTGGGGTALTLNDGIVYLLLMPWFFAGVVGYLWYRFYKRRKLELEAEAQAPTA